MGRLNGHLWKPSDGSSVTPVGLHAEHFGSGWSYLEQDEGLNKGTILVLGALTLSVPFTALCWLTALFARRHRPDLLAA